MRSLTYALAATLLAAAAFAQAPAADAPAVLPPGIAWRPDFEKALDEAKAANRPLMVAFTMVDEPANVAMAKQHFKDKDIIAFSRKFVCVLAHTGRLDVVDGVRFDGSAGKVCERYGSVTSQECNRVDMQARGALMDAPNVSAPQFIFLKPDGESVLLRHVWMLPAQELLQKMQMAYGFFDPQSAPAGFKEHRDRVELLLKDAHDTNVPRRRAALQTLSSVDDPRVVDFFVQQTKPSVESLMRLEAIFFSGQKGNAKVLPCLHELLRLDDSLTRVYTAVALEQIGMVESVPVILDVMKREKKGRVRSNLLRCLMACAGDASELRKEVLRYMKDRGQVERVTALFVASGLAPDKELSKAILACAKDRNTAVRCAGYAAIGNMQLAAGKELLEKAVKSERGRAKDFCQMALAALGGPSYDGDLDAAEAFKEWIPDSKLREGELTGI